MAVLPRSAASQANPPLPESQAVEEAPYSVPMGIGGPQAPEETGHNILALVSLIANHAAPAYT
jgi:hypothetical protein